MTTTILSSATKEVTIGFGQPFVMIGERINPTGRKILAAEMKAGDYSRVGLIRSPIITKGFPKPIVTSCFADDKIVVVIL
jgi:hypothetical protein